MSNGIAPTERRRQGLLAGALLALLVWCSTAHADPLTREFVAIYELKGLITFGETTYRLNRRPGGKWRLEAETVAVNSLAWLNSGHKLLATDWQMQGDWARPLFFVDENTFGSRNKRKETRFDWKAGKAVMSKKGKQYPIALAGDELDPLLYQLVLRQQLARDLAGGREDYRFRIAEGKRVNDYHFRVVARETVEVPYGEFETVVLVRVGDKHQTKFWCAPQLDFLPIKIVQTEKDGDQYTAVLKSLSGIRPRP